MMDCKTAMELINVQLDEPLADMESKELADHIQHCEKCACEQKQLTALVESMKELAEIKAPDELRERLHRQLALEPKHARKGTGWRVFATVAAAMLLLVAAAAMLPQIGNKNVSYDMAGVASAPQTADYEEGQTSEEYEMPAEDNGAVFGSGSSTDEVSRGDSGKTAGAAVAPAPAATASPEGSQSAASQNEVQERKIIYTAYVSLTSESFDDHYQQILTLVDQTNGHLESSSVSGRPFTEPDGYGRTANLTIRVPAEQYQQLLSSASGVAKLISREESSQDISLNYYDRQGWLETYESQRDQLLILMQSAQTMEDILAIQQQLTQVNYQIESLTRELRIMDDDVDYSTIHLTLQEVRESRVIDTPNPNIWEQMVNGLYQSLNAIVNGLQNAVITIVSIMPYLVLLALAALIVWLVVRSIRKRHKQ